MAPAKDDTQIREASYISDGIYVYLRLIHVEVSQETTKLCKAIILQ